MLIYFNTLGRGCRELPDLGLFPELKELRISTRPRLERLISTMPMTALEGLETVACVIFSSCGMWLSLAQYQGEPGR